MGRKSKSAGKLSKAKADWAIEFIQNLTHTKGEWAGKPFALQPWQRKFLRELFGRAGPDGLRQYRTAYLEVPRKNGKSEIAAAIALYLLFGDGEQGAEIYSAAADRDQASLVFNAAATMARNSPVLSGMCKILDSQKRIVCHKTNSFYRAISAEAYSKHGFNAHAVIYDEVHCAPNRELWDTLQTSMGARTQPLMLGITTAGADRNSICWELHDYARKVINGNVVDPSFFGVIYGADDEDPWEDPKTWAKANPSLGVTIKKSFLEQECKRAQEIPAYQNTFRRLYLDQWTSQDTRWLDMSSWNACGSSEEIPWRKLAPLRCWAGVDLSSTTDLSACAVVTEPDEEGIVHVLSWAWIPGDNVPARERRDRVPYGQWAADGHMVATDGNVIDHDYIRKAITDEIKSKLSGLARVGYDPWNATKWAVDLENDGVPVAPIRQGYKTLSPACKELERLVLGKTLRHYCNPVLGWAMDNVVVQADPAGNIKPAKDKATERIDPAVALIIAIATMQEFGAVEEPVNPYADRGILVL